MVDIFDEVDEELRAERAEKLLKKYAPHLLGVALAIIAAAAGWQYYDRYRAQQDAAAASRFIAAESALGRPSADRAAQLPTLEQLASGSAEGYRVLAGLRAAAILADSGDMARAVALWNGVSSDSHADPLLRDFASLMVGMREADKGDPAEAEARLKPLADPGNPWSALAREQLAVLDLRQGKIDDARKMLEALSTDIDAPSGLRARVAALLTGEGPQEKK